MESGGKHFVVHRFTGHSFSSSTVKLLVSFVTVGKARLHTLLEARTLGVKLIEGNILLLKGTLQISNKSSLQAFESTELTFMHHLIVGDLLGLALVNASNTSEVGLLV